MKDKQCSITRRQRFSDALSHRESDRVPSHLWITPELREKLDAHFGSSAWQDKLDVLICEPWFVLPETPCDDKGNYVDVYGSIWQAGAAKHMVKPAIPEPTMAGFTWPDLAPAWEEQRPAMAAQIAQSEDRFCISSFGSCLFERAWMLRGFEALLCELITDEAFCAVLFDELFAHQQELSGRLLTLDIDAVWYSDDWSGQQGPLFSPELWRQWIKPRFAGIIEKTHKAGKRVILHCCGNLEAFIPELIEIGVDCLQCVQPEAMDPMTLKREFGKDMCFWGCVPIQGLPALSPTDIRTYVQRLREKMAVGGGYICSPAKALDETIPLDKAIALIESVADITLQ